MPSSTSVPHSENPDAELAAALAASTRFGHLLHVMEAETTQVLAAATDGQAVVWADHQVRGRGRQGRTWLDHPARDIAVSFRIESLAVAAPGRLAAAAPVAVARTVEQCLGRPPRIKWPNDVFVDGRKISGLLIDSANGGGTYVLGIGINVNRSSFPSELSDVATSLALTTGREWDRHDIVRTLALNVEDVLTTLESLEGTAALGREFAERTGLLGREVRLEGPPGTPRGVLSALDLDHATLRGRAPIPLGVIQQMRRDT